MFKIIQKFNGLKILKSLQNFLAGLSEKKENCEVFNTIAASNFIIDY